MWLDWLLKPVEETGSPLEKEANYAAIVKTFASLKVLEKKLQNLRIILIAPDCDDDEGKSGDDRDQWGALQLD